MAEYEKSYYCFSCERTFWKREAESKLVFSDGITYPPSAVQLPKGAQSKLPKKAKAFLYNYHFTDETITKWKMYYHEDCPIWSVKHERMVGTGPRIILTQYAAWPEGLEQLLWWEGKALDKTSQIKTINNGGKKEYFRTLPTASFSLIIVEDILSAIRVHEATGLPTLALRGTKCDVSNIVNNYMNLGIELPARNGETLHLPGLPLKFYLWLDGDRPGQKASSKAAPRFGLYGKLKVIKTKLDPKCYTDEEIKKYIDV